MDQINSTVLKGGIAITVDVIMPEDSPLQELRSPSHPIAVVLGKTSTGKSQPPHLSRASATLALGTSTLHKDFVLEIIHQVRCSKLPFLHDSIYQSGSWDTFGGLKIVSSPRMS